MTDSSDAKTVLVSGASRGIGRHCALALAGAGFQVLAGVRSEPAAEELAACAGIRPVQLDITSAASIETLAGSLADVPLHGVVNNAGTAVLGPMEFLPLDDLRHEFEVNLFGHIAVLQAVLPKLRAVRGRVVNISSISGFIGFPFFGAYAASKFAMEGFSDALRRELRDAGVAVSVIQPGNIDTGIWEASFTRGSALEDSFPPEASAVYGKRFQANGTGSYGPARKSSPDAVADAVVRAMTDRRPKPRYLVGRDAQRLARLRRLLPDALLDRFI
jgi:NAD(P)-dependent dehydrogenase (short-subunit alcohol dehydrogenase family)